MWANIFTNIERENPKGDYNEMMTRRHSLKSTGHGSLEMSEATDKT